MSSDYEILKAGKETYWNFRNSTWAADQDYKELHDLASKYIAADSSERRLEVQNYIQQLSREMLNAIVRRAHFLEEGKEQIEQHQGLFYEATKVDMEEAGIAFNDGISTPETVKTEVRLALQEGDILIGDRDVLPLDRRGKLSHTTVETRIKALLYLVDHQDAEFVTRRALTQALFGDERVDSKTQIMDNVQTFLWSVRIGETKLIRRLMFDNDRNRAPVRFEINPSFQLVADDSLRQAAAGEETPEIQEEYSPEYYG